MEVRYAVKAFSLELADDGELLLFSPSYPLAWRRSGDGWRSEPAVCEYRSDHVPPEPRCTCGIYATYDIDEAQSYGLLLGIVRPIGRTIPARNGWRAAGAICEMLAVRYPQILDYLPDPIRQHLVPWAVFVENIGVRITGSNREDK
jgi:hypothetical protein